MSWELHTFTADRQLVEELAVEISQALQAAVASRDQATLAVSGGSTPLALFERLSDADIEWDKVTVTLVDERWVDEDNPDSNARLVRTRLLKGRARYARFLGLKSTDADPFAAESRVNQSLSSLSLPLDVVVLGMGGDGHTASFFAGARGVEQAMNPQTSQLCCAVEPLTAPHPRMTLSLPVIVSARKLFLHIAGSSKKAVLDQAIGSQADEPSRARLPIAAVLQQAPGPVQIYYAESGDNS